MPCGRCRDEKSSSTFTITTFFRNVYFDPKKMHIKRAWHLLVFIGIFEVLDYLLSPITTFKSTPMAGTPSLGLGINLKVSKFQRFQSSVNFAIFYSVMCISVLCFLHHRHSIWFYYPFCILLLLTPYCGYYCPRGGENLRFLCNFASHHRKTFLQFCKTVSHHCTGRCSVAKWSRIVAKGIYTNAKRPRIIARPFCSIVSCPCSGAGHNLLPPRQTKTATYWVAVLVFLLLGVSLCARARR